MEFYVFGSGALASQANCAHLTLTSHSARRREARAARLKYSPTSTKLRFAKYLADELRRVGIVAERVAIDCPCCMGTYRPDLPGVVRWRLVTPCGHWCCCACDDRLTEEAAATGKQSVCPECREVVRRGFTREWAGRVLVDGGEAGSVCSASD